MSTLTDRSTGRTGLEAIGTVIYHFRVLDSTNTYALKLLSQIRPKAGTLISADYQTTGRGQMGRDWHSAPGLNLCLSCILYPETNAQNQFAISMAVALAVRDTVADFINQERVKIKWPNDIYVGDKKIAGILIQTSIHGNVIIYCVAGIGLNVNETDFPAELPNPTSLKLETTETLDRDLPDGSQELSILGISMQFRRGLLKISASASICLEVPGHGFMTTITAHFTGEISSHTLEFFKISLFNLVQLRKWMNWDD